ncbi:MAG: T9SS type A sorting domain-containing protein [Bacteroidia bacterium]
MFQNRHFFLVLILLCSTAYAQRASFTLSDTTPCAFDTLTLNDGSLGTINSWRWIIERGTTNDTLSGQGPHTIIPGAVATIRVRLWINGPNGNDSTFSDITILPAPAVNIFIFGQNPFCANDGVLLDAGFHTRYRWSTGDTTPSLLVRRSGEFWVEVTGANGCTARDTVETFAIPGPSISVIASGPLVFCEGDSVILDGGDHVDYLWNGQLGGQFFIVRESSTNILVATDSTGCGNSDTVEVVVRPSRMERIPNTFLCKGDTIEITLPGFPTVLWSNGVNGATTKVTRADTLTATLVDSFGCEGSLSPLIIREVSLPEPVITLNAFSIPQTGIYTRYQWYWIDTLTDQLALIPGATAQDLDGINYTQSPAGSEALVVRVIDGLGCEGQSDHIPIPQVGIGEQLAALQVWPQPASEFVNIQLPANFISGAEVQIWDLNGRLRFQKKMTPGNKLKLSTQIFSPGIYMLQISAQGRFWQQKIFFSKK